MGQNLNPTSLPESEDPLSYLAEAIAQLIRSRFPRDRRREAATLLLEGCGPGNLLMPGNSSGNRERVQLAVLELSKGDIDRLRHFISEAQLDWRDVLMWAFSSKPGGQHGNPRRSGR